MRPSPDPKNFEGEPDQANWFLSNPADDGENGFAISPVRASTSERNTARAHRGWKSSAAAPKAGDTHLNGPSLPNALFPELNKKLPS